MSEINRLFKTPFFSAKQELKETMCNKIGAFETWACRRILTMPWMDTVSNESVVQRLNKEREVMQMIKIRKHLLYIGHI